MTTDRPPGFTCPVCAMTSHHPKDIEHGYCGNCHAFTGDALETVHCYCLCPTHLDSTGGICQIGRPGEQVRVRVTGGAVELDRPVLMCRPCADWWATNQPNRATVISPAG